VFNYIIHQIGTELKTRNTMQVPQDFRSFIESGGWEKVVSTARSLCPAMATHFGEDRGGGVITLFERSDHWGFSISTQEVVGKLDARKSGRCLTLSLEKSSRAARLNSLNSWVAMRDPDQQQHGGAFNLAPYPLYLSLAGWGEVDDVAFGAYALWRAEIFKETDVIRVFENHPSEVTSLLLNRYAQLCTVLDPLER
jgi:hypothetical protein